MPYGFYLSGSRVTLRMEFRTIKFQLTFYKIIIMSSLLYSPLLIKALRLKKIELLFRLCVNTRLSMALRMIGI
jgi:hypothetical protein